MLSGASSNISDAIRILWQSLPRDERELLAEELAKVPASCSLDYRIGIREARKSLNQAENN